MNETSQRLFDAIRDHDFDFAVCVTDGRLDQPGPHILFVNDHFTKLTGYAPEDVIGKSPRLLQGPKSDREVLTRLKQTLRTGGFFRGQTVNYRKDGSEFLMAWSVSGVGTDGEGPALYLAVQHDAARSLAAEMMNEVLRCHLLVLGKIDPSLETVQMLRDQVEYANSIVETVRTPLLVLDNELRVKRANRRYFDTFRADPDATLGKYFYQLDDGGWDIPELRHLLDDVLPSKNPFEEFEVRHHFPRVGDRIILLNACQLPLAGPRRDLILLAMEDVTERRKAEVELLSRANLFVAMLAHELRNPMAPILTAVGVLKEAEPRSAAWDKAMGTIERQVEQSNRLIEDLLDVSRVTRGKIQLRTEPIDLKGLVEQAVESVRPVIERNEHDLHVSLPWKPVSLTGDPTRLLQVLTNLLGNAAKYTPAGGRIELAATTDHAAGRLTISVKDTGVGIEPELLPKVFDLFMQEDRSLSRAGGGLGIGLTLVKNLVELHGGAVSAASGGPGKGSEFRVVLPFRPASAAEKPKPAAKPATASAPSALRVVVIDDNTDAADTTAMLLEAWGHTVATAYDGPSGVEVVRRERPDVVLMDIGLPGLNGYEVAAKLKADGIAPRLMVAVTGYGHEADRQRAEWAGFHRHLVKPAKPDDIARILADARPQP